MTTADSPFPHPPTFTPEQQAQHIADRDRLTHLALLATDNVIIDNASAIAALPGAYRSRITVEAAIGYLISAGLIQITPADQWPEYVSLELADYLKPDVAGAAANFAQVRAAMFPNGVTR